MATRWRKKCEDMFIHFHRIHKSDIRTHRQTLHDGIGHAPLRHRIARQKTGTTIIQNSTKLIKIFGKNCKNYANQEKSWLHRTANFIKHGLVKIWSNFTSQLEWITDAIRQIIIVLVGHCKYSSLFYHF